MHIAAYCHRLSVPWSGVLLELPLLEVMSLGLCKFGKCFILAQSTQNRNESTRPSVVGDPVGVGVGAGDGRNVGSLVGIVGSMVGVKVGAAVGVGVGLAVGPAVLSVGSGVGS